MQSFFFRCWFMLIFCRKRNLIIILLKFKVSSFAVLKKVKSFFFSVRKRKKNKSYQSLKINSRMRICFYRIKVRTQLKFFQKIEKIERFAIMNLRSLSILRLNDAIKDFSCCRSFLHLMLSVYFTLEWFISAIMKIELEYVWILLIDGHISLISLAGLWG